MVSVEILWILSRPQVLKVSSTHCTSNKLGLFGQDFSKCSIQDDVLCFQYFLTFFSENSHLLIFFFRLSSFQGQHLHPLSELYTSPVIYSWPISVSYLRYYACLPVFFQVMEEDKWEILKYQLCKICFIVGKYKLLSFSLFTTEASYFSGL